MSAVPDSGRAGLLDIREHPIRLARDQRCGVGMACTAHSSAAHFVLTTLVNQSPMVGVLLLGQWSRPIVRVDPESAIEFQ